MATHGQGHFALPVGPFIWSDDELALLDRNFAFLWVKPAEWNKRVRIFGLEDSIIHSGCCACQRPYGRHLQGK